MNFSNLVPSADRAVIYFVCNGGNFKQSASFVELFISAMKNKVCAGSFYIKFVTFLDNE